MGIQCWNCQRANGGKQCLPYQIYTGKLGQKNKSIERIIPPTDGYSTYAPTLDIQTLNCAVDSNIELKKNCTYALLDKALLL